MNALLLTSAVRKYEWDLVPGSQHQNGIVMSGMDIIGPKELRLVFKKRYQLYGVANGRHIEEMRNLRAEFRGTIFMLEYVNGEFISR